MFASVERGGDYCRTYSIDDGTLLSTVAPVFGWETTTVGYDGGYEY
jgi:hypothetical protein